MEIKDIFGLGKILPLEKLLETLERGLGRSLKSYFDRKDIDSKAYEIKKLAESKAYETEKLAESQAKAMNIISSAIQENYQSAGSIEYKNDNLSIASSKQSSQNIQHVLTDSSLEQRAQERLNFQEAKKQLNIENVISIAAEELKDEPAVTDEPLNEDWTTRFFRIVEDVSEIEMQILWGKILAGEIKRPKSYSIRTLELIRNLSKDEAALFMKVARFAILQSNVAILFKGEGDHFLRGDYGVSYLDIVGLMEIGLIQPGDFMNLDLHEKANEVKVFTSGNLGIVIKYKTDDKIQVPIDIFSSSGYDLLKLVNAEPHFDYLNSFAKFLQNRNNEVKYSTIVTHDSNSVTLATPMLDF